MNGVAYPDILVFLYTYDRKPLLMRCLESMFRNPGMHFRVWLLDNGSYFSQEHGAGGAEQLDAILDYYKKGMLERVILNNRNLGIHFPINQIMAQLKIQSENPPIYPPEFTVLINDDMEFEDGWLTECYQTFQALETTERVAIVSPFHCHYLSGALANGMETIKTVNYNGINYEIKNYVSGNTWFMRNKFFVETLDWYPVNHPIEGGDWQKLAILRAHDLRCAITPREMAHHMPEAQGRGEYNRLGHW